MIDFIAKGKFYESGRVLNIDVTEGEENKIFNLCIVCLLRNKGCL